VFWTASGTVYTDSEDNQGMKSFDIGRFFQRNPVQAKEDTPTSHNDGALRSNNIEVELSDVGGSQRRSPSPGTTILVVDDSKTIQVVLTRMLAEYGYQTLSAYDGQRAVDLTHEHKPALVLMDVVMPGMNGFQATREIRKDLDPEISSIPVIIMSGNAQPTEEFWSIKIKANGFIAKPFSDEDLLGLIEGQLFKVDE
jgi:twitching motility two-component system response regulator PilH